MTITAKAKYVSHPSTGAGRIRVTWKDATGRHTRHVGSVYGPRPGLADSVALAMGVSPAAVTFADDVDASGYWSFAVGVSA